MKQSTKLQPGMEDPKQTIIHLDLISNWSNAGLSKKMLKALVAQRASKLQHLKIFGGIFFYTKVEQ